MRRNGDKTLEGSRWRGHAVGLAAAMTLLGAPGGSAHAQAGDGAGQAQIAATEARLPALEQELYKLGEEIRFVETQYVRKEQQREASQHDLQAEYGMALVKYGDFETGATVLFDLVEQPQFKSNRAYFAAVDALGEALFQRANYAVAQEYLDIVLKQGTVEQSQHALQRMIEIASRTRRFEELDTYLAMLSSGSGAAMKPEVIYILGKSIFAKGDYAKAREAFGRVPQGQGYYLQAQYYIGLSHLEQKDAGKALEVFRALSAMVGNTPEERRVADLAKLAVARIHFERGEYDLAHEAYQKITTRSPLFFESLFEVAWTHIKRNEQDAAMKVLDLYTVANPNASNAPEVKLVLGDMQLRSGLHEYAYDTYRSVLDKMEHVATQLTKAIAMRGDPEQYYFEVSEDRRGETGKTGILPQNARDEVVKDPLIAAALRVVADLTAEQDSVERTIRKVEALKDRMAGINAVESFATLREGTARSISVRAELDNLSRAAHDLRVRLVLSALPPASRTELEAARKERLAQEKNLAAVPRTGDDMVKRVDEQNQVLDQVDAEIANCRRLIATLRSELDVIERRLAEIPGSKRDPKIEAVVKENILSERRRIEQMEKETTELEVASMAQAGEVGVNAEESAAGLAMTRHRAAMRKEDQIIEGLKNTLPAAIAALLARIDKFDADIAGHTRKATGVRNQLEALVREKASAVTAAIDGEFKTLTALNQDLGKRRDDSKFVTGQIAYGTLRDVAKHFQNLVLRADLGILDVNWTRYQIQQRKILSLAKAKNGDLDVLNGDFKEVMSQEDP